MHLLERHRVAPRARSLGCNRHAPQRAAAHADERTDPSKGPLTLSITADGRLFLEKTPISREALAKTLAPYKGRRLMLKGD